jgi:hypothetical protein
VRIRFGCGLDSRIYGIYKIPIFTLIVTENLPEGLTRKVGKADSNYRYSGLTFISEL